MSQQGITIISLLVDELTDFLAVNQYMVRLFNAQAAPGGVEAIKIDAGKNVIKLDHGAITGGTSASLEKLESGVDFQTTNEALVILIIAGSAVNLTDVEIIEDATVNAGTGTVKQKLDSISLGDAQLVTSKLMTFAASKFITVKAVTGNVGDIVAWVIE